MHHPEPLDCEPVWVRPREARRIAGVGNTKLYEWIANGTVKSVRVDGRRLISFDSIKRLGEQPEVA